MAGVARICASRGVATGAAVRIAVEYLGPARDWAGRGDEAFDVDTGASLGAFVDRMLGDHPELAARRVVLRFAVNLEFADEQRTLVEGDRVAVIPPVSGGTEDDVVVIVQSPIDVQDLRRHVGGDSAVGGVVAFDGVTRFEEHPVHGGLIRLEYEAYNDMAVSEMRKLASEARQLWTIRRIAFAHRTGPVPIGEASVVIVVACGHRAEAFSACSFLIDGLKQRVPIWKKEVWANGESSWVDPTAT